MKTSGMCVKRVVLCAVAVVAVSFAAWAVAGEMKHGDMPGMKMEGHGSAEGHGKMGDKVFAGKIGPWNVEARLMDMKAHMEAAKSGGMKMEGTMKNTHHVALHLTDPKTKKDVSVTEGKGTVTVVGPDKKEAKSDFMVMQGHFGADVDLSKAGKYTFNADIESGDKKGSTTFAYTVK